jgi:hypothetical protein
MAKRTCSECIYAGRPSLARYARNRFSRWTTMLTCVNHPDSPGDLRDVLPDETCRNFRARPSPPVRLEPPPPPREGLCYITLTRGKFALVDAADYEWLSTYRWHATCTRGRYYAATVIDGKSVSMHRMIMNPPPGMVTDHIDGNGLNNYRDNIRNCTREQNRHNTRPTGKRSRYVGVYPRRDKWFYKIKHKREYHYGGPFDTEIEAARARDQKAIEVFGEFAWLNFPDESS